MKEKSKNVNVKFYNVVIHPSDKHEPKYYVDLFDVIHEQGKSYYTSNDKKTKLRVYSKLNDLIQCTLINYTKLDDNDDWYDEARDKVVKHETDPNIYPHAKEWDIFFLPEKHRMAVVGKKGISWSQIEKYFNNAFEDAISVLGYDEVVLNQETSQEAIDQVFSYDNISSLEIEVSYSNNDTNDITAAAIDAEFKSNNVGKIKTKATGTKGKPFTLKKDESYIAGLVKLAKHNGYVKADGHVGKNRKKINTRNYPMVKRIKSVTPMNIGQKVKEVLLSLF